MSNELNRVLSNPDNFLVSNSLAGKFEEPKNSHIKKSHWPILDISTDNNESFKVSIISWSKSTKDGYYQFKCKSKSINDIYSIGGIHNIDKITISGIETEKMTHSDRTCLLGQVWTGPTCFFLICHIVRSRNHILT